MRTVVCSTGDSGDPSRLSTLTIARSGRRIQTLRIIHRVPETFELATPLLELLVDHQTVLDIGLEKVGSVYDDELLPGSKLVQMRCQPMHFILRGFERWAVDDSKFWAEIKTFEHTPQYLITGGSRRRPTLLSRVREWLERMEKVEHIYLADFRCGDDRTSGFPELPGAAIRQAGLVVGGTFRDCVRRERPRTLGAP